MSEVLSVYRDYEIVKVSDTEFHVVTQGGICARCATAWSCIVWIDGVLSP